MATTMTTPTGSTVSRPARNSSYQVVYWIIGVAIVLAIALFFVMRRNATMAPETVPPTTVEQRSAPADTTVPTDTTTNPAAPTPGMAPGGETQPSENRY